MKGIANEIGVEVVERANSRRDGDIETSAVQTAHVVLD